MLLVNACTSVRKESMPALGHPQSVVVPIRRPADLRDEGVRFELEPHPFV